MRELLFGIISLGTCSLASVASAQLHFEGKDGVGKGQKIVFLSGDEEYRSEETNPMLAKILSQRFGYDCTVLFSMDSSGQYVDPNNQKSLVGLSELDDADLMIIGTRFRRLDDESYAEIAEFLDAGKPVIGFRTATHAFRGDGQTGDFQWKNFGVNILGEGWVNHHGKHKDEGTRGVINEANAQHVVLNGVKDIFGPSDVYGVRKVNKDNATILLNGEVTKTLQFDSPAVNGKKNEPMMPLAWLREYTAPNGTSTGTAFCTTMGASIDFESEDLRRLVVNAAIHLTGQEVPEKADVSYVDPFEATFYGSIRDKGFYKKRNLKVEDFKLGSSPATGIPEKNIPDAWTRALAYKKAAAEQVLVDPKDAPSSELPLPLEKGKHIVMVGNGLGDGFQRHGHFEAYLQAANPGKELVVRNLCHPGFTAGFRPHPSRVSQWAFPGAEEFRPEFEVHQGKGHYPTEDEWLKTVQADAILGFFGFNESFDGEEGLAPFEGELKAFIAHTRTRSYNGKSSPEIVLVSPIAPETWVDNFADRVAALESYTAVMAQVAKSENVGFVNLFELTKKSAEEGGSVVKTPYGVVPDDEGYRFLGKALLEKLFAISEFEQPALEKVLAAVKDKNWYWMNDYRMPNGVHVYGRRYKPYGDKNYPLEIQKNREMTENRDQAIWALAQGETFDLAAADAGTVELAEISTNYKPSKKNGSKEYLYGEDALDSLTIADGFQIELFADERQFPNLANPVQMSFDNKGRLWIATMPSYPHFQPGDAKPDDKILIYEDTNGDGKADKETVFADGLSLPMGFELAPEGVYVSLAPDLVLMRDTNGDDVCDSMEVVITGFDHHDTHHAISAFCADPSGGIMLSEGIFLHTNTETVRGPVRGVNGGFYRYDPRKKHLERTVQTKIPNPWGVAFDEWGQDFFLHTSSTKVNWMLPVSVKTSYGVANASTTDLIPKGNRVRPTSGLEFVSSSHFPAEMRGDMLLCNNIGFLGIKQHKIEEDGTGYKVTNTSDLLVSKDGNFRPVDLEFAPDGSLYVVDWHNVLIGHMQHNARDPYRDHSHGRIYRITYKNRNLLKPTPIAGAPIADLLEKLNVAEYRERYRTRRELRGRDSAEVLAAVKSWASKQTSEHALLEALWVSWGAGEVDQDLVRKLIKSSDHRVRAAAVRALRYNHQEFSDAASLLATTAEDSHGRVRLETAVVASWMGTSDALKVAELAKEGALDDWNKSPIEAAFSRVSGLGGEESAEDKIKVPNGLKGTDAKRYLAGHEVFHREGYCATCHQEDGQGLPTAGFPPVAGTDWVTGDAATLIKVVLNGLMGPITVNGVDYPGHVPMTGFGGLLNDEEVASVLTYVRNSFGNKAKPVSPEKVKEVRAATKDKVGFYNPQELRAK